MARYRKYKNGIYGLKERGWYAEIVATDGRKKTFQIVDDKGNRYPETYDDINEAIWQIDIRTATDGDKAIIQKLYSADIFSLTGLIMQYYDKGIYASKRDEVVVNWADKVRYRKDHNLPMGFDPE